VALPVLQRAFPDRPPFRLFALDPAAAPAEALRELALNGLAAGA
jgi:hypothetical protein